MELSELRGSGDFLCSSYSPLLNCCCSVFYISWPQEVFRMSRALQALFLPCFLVFLKNRIISLGFNICFPLLFLTVAHSVFLFLGCQGQPGEGPVWLGRHIWWGSKGRGSDQHRGQWGHRQGSGVDLWYDISATAPWSDYLTNVLLINWIQQHIDAGPFEDVNIIEN